MKIPTYGLAMDIASQQPWMVCLKAPFTIFAVDVVGDKDCQFTQPVFPESCAPSGLKEAFFANPYHAKVKHRHFLPSALSNRVKLMTSRLPKALPGVSGGISVEPITRPGILLIGDMGGGKPRQGVLDLRDMSSPVYAPIVDGDGEPQNFFRTLFRYTSGQWVEESAFTAPGFPLYVQQIILHRMMFNTLFGQ